MFSLLTLGAIGAAFAAPLLPPGVPTDYAKLSGRWYQHRVNVEQLVNQGGSSPCATVTFELMTKDAGGNTVDTWVRYRGTAQKDNATGPLFPLTTAFANVTGRNASNTGEVDVTFDYGTFFPTNPAFTVPENIVYVEGTGDRYDFIILASATSPNFTDFSSVYALSRDTEFDSAFADKLTDFLAARNYTNQLYTVPHPATCYYSGPGVSPPIIDVDDSYFSGIWYQHIMDVGQIKFQGQSSCGALEYSDEGEGMPILDTSVSQVTGEEGKDFPVRVLYANGTREGKSGNISIVFPAGMVCPQCPEVNSSVWVLHAEKNDNGEYEMNIGSSGEEKYTAIFLNTRSKTLDPLYKMKFDDFVKATGFFTNLTTVPQPEKCNYGPLNEETTTTTTMVTTTGATTGAPPETTTQPTKSTAPSARPLGILIAVGIFFAFYMH